MQEPNYEKEFASKLKELRGQKRLSRPQAAIRFHVSKSTYKDWELGRRFPSLPKLIDITTYFNTTIDNLLGLQKVAA